MQLTIIDHDLDAEGLADEWIDAEAELAAGRIHIWSSAALDRQCSRLRRQRCRRRRGLRAALARLLERIAGPRAEPRNHFLAGAIGL